MKYLLLLLVCLLSFSAGAFEDILYDFKTRTPGNNIYAYKGSTSTQVPSNLALGAQVSSVEYNALKLDDQSYQHSTTSTNNSFPYTQFVITIDEDEADITKFTIL